VSKYMDSAPSDTEIIVAYWKAEADGWYVAANARVDELDALTLDLEHAFGPDWRGKVERKLQKKYGGDSLSAG
jgi:hypothetical protein